MNPEWMNLDDGYNPAPAVDAGFYYKTPIPFMGSSETWRNYKMFCLDSIYQLVRNSEGNPLVDFDLVKQFLFEQNIEPNEADIFLLDLGQKVVKVQIQGLLNLNFNKVIAVTMTDHLGALFYDYLKSITFQHEGEEWRVPIGTASVFVDEDPNKFLQISVPVPIKKNQEIIKDNEGRLNIINVR